MSKREPRSDEPDPIETARQVHTLAHRLLRHISAAGPANPTAQTDTVAETPTDDPSTTYWYP